MKKTFEKLWNDYILDECAEIDSEEERTLLKNVIEKHKTINDLLTNEQSDLVEAYVDALCEMQSFFARKAFYKGCEFTASFLFEAWNFEKKIE